MGSSVDVWVCFDDPSYKEGYTRVLGKWLNGVELHPYDDDEHDVAGNAGDNEGARTHTGFFTAVDNVLSDVSNPVYWQYLPEIPKKPFWKDMSELAPAA